MRYPSRQEKTSLQGAIHETSITFSLNQKISVEITWVLVNARQKKKNRDKNRGHKKYKNKNTLLCSMYCYSDFGTECLE